MANTPKTSNRTSSKSSHSKSGNTPRKSVSGASSSNRRDRFSESPKKRMNDKAPYKGQKRQQFKKDERPKQNISKPVEAAPKEINSRALALHMMRHVLDKGQSFDQTQLYFAQDLHQLAERDQAFVRTMLLNSFRYLGQFDQLINEYLESAVSTDHGWVRHFLRIGMVQLLILETPPHAAIGELLRLIDKDKDFKAAKKFKGLINAILGRVTREGRQDFAAQDPVKTNLPNWLYDSWVAAYGEDITRQMAQANEKPAPIDVFFADDVSTDAIKAANLSAIDLPAGGIRLPAGYDLSSLNDEFSGRWWVQDLASALPVKYVEKIISSFTGKTVFDLCAAPGGKTIQMAAQGADVTAVDISKKRLIRLDENLERLGLKADIVTADIRKWDPEVKPDFIFLDAPCSATGTMRRHPDLAHVKRESDIAQLMQTQRQLLMKSMALLPIGAHMVYAVCSLQKEEAEAQVDWILQQHDEINGGQLELCPIDKNMIIGAEMCISPEGYIRCRPDLMENIGGMDGFFAAILKKVAAK